MYLQMNKVSDCRPLYNSVRIPYLGYLVGEEETYERLCLAIQSGFRRFQLTSVRTAQAVFTAVESSGLGRSSFFLGATVHERDACGSMMYALKTGYLDGLTVDTVSLDWNTVTTLWEENERCYRAGFCRSLGLRCNRTCAPRALTAYASVVPMIVQGNPPAMLCEEQELMSWCRARGVSYESVTEGNLNGRQSAALQEMAVKYGCTPFALAVRCRLQSGTLCLLDALTEPQIASFKKFCSFTLSAQDEQRVYRLLCDSE